MYSGPARRSNRSKKLMLSDNSIRAAEREYRGLMKEVDGLNVYIAQLDRQLNAQQEELVGIEESIKNVTRWLSVRLPR